MQSLRLSLGFIYNLPSVLELNLLKNMCSSKIISEDNVGKTLLELDTTVCSVHKCISAHNPEIQINTQNNITESFFLCIKSILIFMKPLFTVANETTNRREQFQEYQTIFFINKLCKQSPWCSVNRKLWYLKTNFTIRPESLHLHFVLYCLFSLKITQTGPCLHRCPKNSRAVN